MSATDQVAIYAPQFVSDSRLSAFITAATARTSASAFGSNRDAAIALRACHMMAMNPSARAGTGGAVSSEQEGAVSRSYVTAMTKRYGDKYPDLCCTSYGVQLIQLIEENVLCAQTAQGNDVASTIASSGMYY